MNPQTPARLTGSASMNFQNPVYVVSCASVVGKKEGEGPLGSKFDLVCEEPMFGEDTWESLSLGACPSQPDTENIFSALPPAILPVRKKNSTFLWLTGTSGHSLPPGRLPGAGPVFFPVPCPRRKSRERQNLS